VHDAAHENVAIVTLEDLVERNARLYPDRPAVSDGREVWSWATVQTLVRSIRQVLGRRGERARVALCGDAGMRTLPLVAGLLSAGISVALLASADLGRTERALEMWSPDAWVSVDPGPDVDVLHRDVAHIARQLPDRRHLAVRARTVASTVFSTSGSTGDPRLVTCPDGRFSAVSCVIAATLGLGPTDRILSASPPHFDYGYNQFVVAAASGACLVQGDYLSLGHLIGVEHQPPTMLAAGPSQLRLITELPEAKVRTAGLRMLTSTGAPFPVEIADQLRELWPACEIRSMYGLTECKRVSISTHDEFVANPATVGHPITNVSVSIDDTTSEILVTTPYLMDFDSSPSSNGPRVVETYGSPMLATGDCGRLLDDGQLEIIGRLSQFAKIYDVRVSLSEAAQLATCRPEVREAAATTEDDQLFIWCEPVGTIDEGRIAEDIRDALVRWTGTNALSNTTVSFLDRLPRLPNGKIDQVALTRIV
jgi:acyl-CoA synthetase (AMP-forming)/AMP-acid ligase II